MTDRVELIIQGTNLPICPACGNGNAMLDDRKFDDKTESTIYTYECRDCGYTINGDSAVLVFTELDASGMGIYSTYTEVKRVNADYS